MATVRSGDGTAIAFDRVGEGPALVVVDGAFAHRAINPTSAALASLLASRFSVTTYDRRGRGESGDTQPFAVEREIEDLAAVIGEAGERAFVLGFSSGAMLALDAAAQGLSIARLALYEPPIIVDDSRPPLPDDYVERLQGSVAAGRPGDAVEIFFADAMRFPPEAIAGMRAGPFWAELQKVAPTLAYDGAFIADTMDGTPLSRDRWSSVTIPTLVIDGGASEAFMHTGADALAAVLPNAERRTLEGQTHDVAAEILAPVLAGFFEAR
jgi:pimeloyl-ACP methyl ester carboxylesterase